MAKPITVGQVREMQSMWGMGFKDREIAAAVGCSIPTVNKYIYHAPEALIQRNMERFSVKGFDFRLDREHKTIRFEKTREVKDITDAKAFIKLAETLYSISLFVSEELGRSKDHDKR